MPPRNPTPEQKKRAEPKIARISEFLSTLTFPMTLLEVSLDVDRAIGTTADALLIRAIKSRGLRLVKRGEYTIVKE